MPNKKGTTKLMQIVTEAKKLYKGGKGTVKSWSAAVKKASKNIKKKI
jgi:hypothetical protein